MKNSPILFIQHSLIHEFQFLNPQPTSLVRLIDPIPIQQVKLILTMFMTPPKSTNNRIHFVTNMIWNLKQEKECKGRDCKTEAISVVLLACDRSFIFQP